jgi:hypothetical protein
VAAVSATDAWAVGSYPPPSIGAPSRTLIEHWNGTAWTQMPSPNPARSAELSGVAAVSATDAWAVGSYSSAGISAQRTFIEHWDGTAWSQVPSPRSGGHYLYAVAAISPTDAWAVGSLIEHWNGTAWKQVPLQYPAGFAGLYGVAAVSATDAWAVGADRRGTLVEHWDGTAWKLVPSPSPGSIFNYLFGVAATSASNAWAVGAYAPVCGLSLTLAEHWDGTRWERVPTPQ